MQTPLDTAHQHPSLAALPPEQATALTQLANAVLHDGVHLMVCAQDGPSVEHAGLALQAWWQAMAPQVVIAHFQSQQALTWIGRINQMVSIQGVELAMQNPSTRTTPLEIGVIHDADQLSPADLKMLKDLAAHLPGLPMRWVLLFKNTPEASSWPDKPCESEARPSAQWLTWRMAQTSPNTPTPALLRIESQAEPIVPALIAQPKKWTDHAVILGLSALFLIGLLAWALRSEQAPPPADATQAQPAPAQNNATSPTSNTEARAESTLSAQPMAPTAIAIEPTHADPEKDPSNTQESAQTNDPDPETSDTNATAIGSVRINEKVNTPKVPHVPEVARRGARWLAQKPSNHYVLEHGRFQSAALAQSVIRGREELKNARIVMVQTKAPIEPAFLLITGPFQNLGRAENYKVRENLPAQIPIVQVSRILQKSLPRPAP